MAKNLYESLDLNLLKTFSVLYQEKNMRKAADRLYVTQSAVSKSLTKMREQLGDHLFVKNSKGMTPTPYADRIYVKLNPILLDLEKTVNSKEDFSPSALTGEIVVAIVPSLLSSLATTIYSIIKADAPNVSVNFRVWKQETLSEIEKGAIDFGLNYESDVTIKTLSTKKVGQDRFRLLCRKDHPYKKRSITPEEVVPYPLGTILAPTWNDKKAVAEVLADELDITFDIALRSEYPTVLFDAVLQSDMMVPVSKYLRNDFIGGVRFVDIDYDAKIFTPDIYSYYHYKNHNSEKFAWLMGVIDKALKSNSISPVSE